MIRLLTPAVFLMTASIASAQSVIVVDRRPEVPIQSSYQIRSVDVTGTLRDQVAEVQVSQVFHNPGRRTLEAEFFFPLPHDGAIQDLVLIADGKELPGRILSAEEARSIYESIVRSKRDPALLEFIGQGLFKTSVFPIAAGAERTVTLRYTRLCRRDRDLVEFLHPVTTKQTVGRLTIDLSVESTQPIKNVYSPSHQPTIDRAGEHRARVRLEQRGMTGSGEFRLFYSLAMDGLGASVLSYKPNPSEDGYFLLLASPGFTQPDRAPLAKTVVFVLDKSGSMSGKKIDQAKAALRFVMNNLNDDDTFNIIAYDNRIDSFKPELQRFDRSSRDEALRYIDSIHAGGSTNIDGALQSVMGMMRDDKRPSYILFLTDGLPTAGEKNEQKIADNAANANKIKARVIGFGVGYDVNARLLDRVTHGNGGVSEYVGPKDDIEVAVGRFYSRIASPVLADLTLEIDGAGVNRGYPRDLPDIFESGQLVFVGRYNRPGEITAKLTGRLGDERHSYIYPSNFADANEGSAYAFVEKLWAMRRVGDLIDQIDLHGRSRELVNELVELSKRHGILTPYTAFLADEDVRLDAVAANQARAGTNLEADLSAVSGRRGVASRANKSYFKQASQAPAPAAEAVAGAFADADELREAERQTANVRQVGNKTFFCKNHIWIDPTVTEEEAKNAQIIKQFSDEHFELCRNANPEQRRYLSQNETVVVRLDGSVYRIEKQNTP